MEIIRIPVLSDNYVFLICDRATQTAVVVDPAEGKPVLDRLEAENLELVAIWNTHHHGDHVGGNRQLLRAFPKLTIYGGANDRDRIPGQHVFLEGGDRVAFADHTAEVLFVPGHTRAHIAYYLPPIAPQDAVTPGHLFCGDTLFAGGCGRLFEGTPAQMVRSLQQIRQLPANTQIWCAHEYTLSNLRFALTVNGANGALRSRFEAVQEARSQNQPTVPTLLHVEQQTNPFLRWDDPEIQMLLGTQEAVETFAALRARKDRF